MSRSLGLSFLGISSLSAILRANREKILHQTVGAQNLCNSLTSVPEDGPQLSAQAGLHQHVDILPVLERLVQPGTEQMETSEYQQCSDSCALW